MIRILQVIALLICGLHILLCIIVTDPAQSHSTPPPKAPNSSPAHAHPMQTVHPPAAASTAVNARAPSSPKSETVDVASVMPSQTTTPLWISRVLRLRARKLRLYLRKRRRLLDKRRRVQGQHQRRERNSSLGPVRVTLIVRVHAVGSNLGSVRVRR